MIVKLVNREDPAITKEIQDVTDLDAVMTVEGDLAMKVETAAGWLSLYPLIDWYIEVMGGYTGLPDHEEVCDNG